MTVEGCDLGGTMVAPPAGYELFFVENVGRHGARSLTTDANEKRALSVCRGAARKGAVTRGKRFDDQLRAFQRAEKKIGYGDLSTLGKDEWPPVVLDRPGHGA
jgi:hypothetical protein